MVRQASIALVLGGLFILTCSGPAESRSLSSNDAARIRTISITTTGNPTHYRLSVGDVSTAIALGIAVGPGAAGGTLQGSLNASGQQTKFDAALAPQNLALGDEMVEMARATVERDGYTVVKGDAADAVLTFDIQDISYERRVWGLVGPHIVVEVTLTDSTTRKILFTHIYWYDMHGLGSFGRTTQIHPDEKYGFDDENEVLAHPEIAVAGFRAMIPKMLDDLGTLLKKPDAP